MPKYAVELGEVGKDDVDRVGGKNASLGEMIDKVDVPVPPGFAVTSEGYDFFLWKAGIRDEIRQVIEKTDIDNIKELIEGGKKIREIIRNSELPRELREEIKEEYRKLGERTGSDKPLVAVRSSATAEDLPTASFAGQQETYLNISGKEDLMDAIRNCMASLFTDRAIHYREERNFNHFKVKLSVGVQKMVDAVCSGIMFTIDPDSGYEKILHIDGSWGLGEMVVGGRVNPDRYSYFKPTESLVSRDLGEKAEEMVWENMETKVKDVEEERRKKYVLSEGEVEYLSKHGILIEKHYGRPMDIEWAKDRDTGKIYILQARPETVHSQKKGGVLRTYRLEEEGRVLCRGQAIGRKISSGNVNVIMDSEEIEDFEEGQVLVTDMTDPDWEPIMKKASAIVTERGGATSHAAIVSRELGIAAVVGTKNASDVLETGQEATVDCSGGQGRILEGKLGFNVEEKNIKDIPETETDVLLNIGVPENAFDLGQYPVQGVGLVRQEFIVSSYIGEHPLKLVEENRSEEYIQELSYGIGKIAAGFYPRPVVVRLSDFKTNEYADLHGGEKYEPKEENPMIGWRGASRYLSEKFKEAFKMECKALKRVREEMGLTNVKIMVPFCRTLEEARDIKKELADNGLEQGKNELELYMMAEIPSNIVLADRFAEEFDGFSIGSNDLTQLIMGVDRDNENLQDLFDERNEAVKRRIKELIEKAKKKDREVSICGNAPSMYPEYIEFLLDAGIDAISVTPDVALKTLLRIHEKERGT